MSPGPRGMLCQSASRSGGAWLEPRKTTNPALTSALCSVTRITPCSLGNLGGGVWSVGSKFKPPAQLLVGTGPGNPLCCSRWASCHRSSTSKSVTGTQSLSSSTMWRPGKTKQRAARTKVPAQVGWTRWRPLAWLMGKYTTSQRSGQDPACKHGWTTRPQQQASVAEKVQDCPGWWGHDCNKNIYCRQEPQMTHPGQNGNQTGRPIQVCQWPLKFHKAWPLLHGSVRWGHRCESP